MRRAILTGVVPTSCFTLAVRLPGNASGSKPNSSPGVILGSVAGSSGPDGFDRPFLSPGNVVSNISRGDEEEEAEEDDGEASLHDFEDLHFHRTTG